MLSKGPPWGTVLEIFAPQPAWMLSLSIPMAVPVALPHGVLAGFPGGSGNHGGQAAGVSPLSPMRPVPVALLIPELLILTTALPEANHRSVELMTAVSRKKPHAFIEMPGRSRNFRASRGIDPCPARFGFETDVRALPIVFADSADDGLRGSMAQTALAPSPQRRESHRGWIRTDPANYFPHPFFFPGLLPCGTWMTSLGGEPHSGATARPVEMTLDVIRGREGGLQ